MSGEIEKDKCDFCKEIKPVERTYLKPSKYKKPQLKDFYDVDDPRGCSSSEHDDYVKKINSLYNQGDYFITIKTCTDCGTPKQ
jgi:hypothetical protein